MTQTTLIEPEVKPLKVFIDSSHIPNEQVATWELTRAKVVLRFLERRFKVKSRKDIDSSSVVAMREECVRVKS